MQDSIRLPNRVGWLRDKKSPRLCFPSGAIFMPITLFSVEICAADLMEI